MDAIEPRAARAALFAAFRPPTALIVLTGLVLLVGAGIAAHLHVARLQPRWAVLLCTGITALVVSYFSAWWLVNGLVLLLNLLGVQPGAAG